MAYKKEILETSICSIDVEVRFSYERYREQNDALHLANYDIEEISFFVAGVDITEIVWEMSKYNEQEWIDICKSHLQNKR